MKKEDILIYLKEIEPQLMQNGITSLGLFGSFAKDNATNKSDIDITYKTSEIFINKYKGWTAFTYLNDNLRDKVSQKFNKKVDLFDLNSNSYIKDKVHQSTIYV